MKSSWFPTALSFLILFPQAVAFAEPEEVLRLKGHDSQVNSVVYSTDGKLLISGSDDKRVIVWNAETGEEVRALMLPKEVKHAALSLDGKRLAAVGPFPDVHLFDPQSGEQIMTLPRVNKYAKGSGAAISPNSRYVAVGDSGGAAGVIQVWDLETGKEAWQAPKAHSSGVNALTFSPDGKLLASGSQDTKVKLWNVETGQEVRTYDRRAVGAVLSLAFSPENRWLAVGNGRNLRLYDLKDEKAALPVVDARAGEGAETVNAVAFSPDGGTIATGTSGGTVRLWETATGKETFVSRALTGSTFGVAFNNDGTRLAVVIGRDISIWSVP